MGISISERESSGNSSGYKIDGLAAEYGFGIPYADDGKYSAVFHYEKVKIDSISATRGTSTVPITVNGVVSTMTVATCTGNTTHCEFEDKHGRSFDLLLLKTSLVHDTRDSFSQPTDGYKLDIAGDIGLPVLDLRYYKLDMVHDHYYQARRCGRSRCGIFASVLALATATAATCIRFISAILWAAFPRCAASIPTPSAATRNRRPRHRRPVAGLRLLGGGD